jgi:hypothetical protein
VYRAGMAAVPDVRRMQPADARAVAGHVRRASRRVPDRRGRLIGRLLPTWVLARLYRWLQDTGRGEIWVLSTPTAMAGVVTLSRGTAVEAVDFFSTGEMLGLRLALELLELANRDRLTVIVDTSGDPRQTYFRRLGFERVSDTRMMRRP